MTKKLFFILPVGLLTLALTSQADGSLQVTFSANAASTTVVDGGAGDNDGVVNNQIVVVGTTVGNYDFNVTLATSNSPGTPLLAFVNNGTNQITGSGATTVAIYASANDFTLPSSPPSVVVTSGSTSQFLGGTVQGNSMGHMFNSYYDTTNVMSSSATGTLVGSGGPAPVVAPGNSALNDSRVEDFNTTPYALNLELIAVLNSPGMNVIDLDGQVRVAPVPEPYSIALWLGLGLVTAVGTRFRKRR